MPLQGRNRCRTVGPILDVNAARARMLRPEALYSHNGPGEVQLGMHTVEDKTLCTQYPHVQPGHEVGMRFTLAARLHQLAS